MTTSGVRQVIWASLGVLSQGASRLVSNVVVGRVGGAAVLGSMATVLAVAQILVTLWPGSLGSTGIKFVARARGRGDRAAIDEIRGHLTLRSVQGCLLLGLGGAAGWALWHRDLVESAAIAIVVLGLGGFGLIQGLLYAERRTRTSSLRETAAAVLSLGVVAALLVYDPYLAGGWLALPLALSMLLYAAVGWPRLRPRSLGSRGRELDLFTLTSALGSVSSQGFIQMSVVVAAAVGRESAGHFAVALALCTPLTLVITPLGLALFPAVNEAVGRGDGDAVRRQITVATHFLAYALLAGGGLMVLVRDQVISAVWGAEFDQAADIFVPLVVASSLGALALPATNGMTSASQRYATQATAWSLVSSLAGVASWLVLVPRWGSVGVAVGLLLGRTIYAVAVLESARRLHAMTTWSGLAFRVALMLLVLGAVDLLSYPVLIQAIMFGVVAIGIVATDATMRNFVREQVPWALNR